jgi:hypothetical protein
MSDTELDRSYTALCQALGAVGPERSQMLLAMLALALIARAGTADEVVELIARSRDRCLQE